MVPWRPTTYTSALGYAPQTHSARHVFIGDPSSRLAIALMEVSVVGMPHSVGHKCAYERNMQHHRDQQLWRNGLRVCSAIRGQMYLVCHSGDHQNGCFVVEQQQQQRQTKFLHEASVVYEDRLNSCTQEPAVWFYAYMAYKMLTGGAKILNKIPACLRGTCPPLSAH